MPEDYQSILTSLGVEEPATTEAAPEAQPEVEPAQPEATPAAPATEDPATPEQKPDGEQAQAPVQNKDNEAFAALRSENTKYKRLIQQLKSSAGFQGSDDDFLSSLSNAAYDQEAKRNNVSPELLRRMDQLEERNKTLVEAQNRTVFAQNLKTLQDTYQLSDNDIKDFIDVAVREHIDLTIPGTNFITLYQGLCFDKLNAKLIEAERQKWIAQDSKSNSATVPDGRSGKKEPEKTDVNTMAEFDSLLQSIPTK